MRRTASFAIVTALLLAASGCGWLPGRISDRSGPNRARQTTPSAERGKAIAAAPMATGTGKIWNELLSVRRGPAGTILIHLRLTNRGEETFNVGYNLADPADMNGLEADGITLVDAVRNKRYFPLTGADGKCLCSDTTSASIAPGGSAELYAVLPAPPAEVTRVAVAMPLTPVFGDIAIDKTPTVLPAGTSPRNARPPKILPLISTVEGDKQSVDEDDVNESVRLSSDVLFALNEANLSPAARSILADVAERIGRSPGKTVAIDGHTDDNGNDAINEPLSRRRATAVEGVLKGLVTRQDVTYRSAGHGSKEPIAGNQTEQGRRKNRRVTVTFARPVPRPGPSRGRPTPADGAASGRRSAPIATAQPQIDEVRDLKLDITAVTRDSTGLISLNWRLTNNGANAFSRTTQFLPDPSVTFFRYAGGTMGVTLRDDSRALRYFSLRDRDKNCLCTDLVGTGTYSIPPGATMTHFNAFMLPSDVASVSVEFPGYRPVRNIRIS